MTKMILEPIIRSARNFFHGVFKKKLSPVLQAPYDGAGHGKRLGNWYPSSSFINTLLASSLSTLRTRSHDLVRKNPYAANAIESIVSNCIGTGIKPQSKAKNSDFGTVSYESIGNVIAEAIDDPNVKSILLDIDSSGGKVSGLFDLVDFISESRNEKPIYAIANDHAFSAAYAIASAATKIFVNRTSGIGNIGVIATHVDLSEFDKKEGIKYTTIFAGDRKNDLSPHEPISDEAISDLQKEVDRLYGMFVATVARNRNISTAQIKATQAALYYGADSLSLGLADEVANFNRCLSTITGGNQMTEDIDLYKADVLEISKLCKLAHAENKISGNIQQEFCKQHIVL
ncbi:MAG: S49 family peptidase [Holosporaceae bacterium]|jgi:signal peptide peptidase SppA|nr:S49 family peptidase [Holosporaceae bacterium]